MPRLDLTGLPDDPIERLLFLAEVHDETLEQLHQAYAETYFDARLHGLLDQAIEVHRHARYEILAMTRRVNYRRGSSVRWSDGADTG